MNCKCNWSSGTLDVSPSDLQYSTLRSFHQPLPYVPFKRLLTGAGTGTEDPA